MSEPEFRSFLRSVIRVLEDLKFTYAIGGSVASSAYGEARSTHDVDISVVLPVDQVLPFTEAFQALGYYVTLDAVLDAIIGRQMFNIIDARSGYKADIFPVDPTRQPSRKVRSCSGVGLGSMMYPAAPRQCCSPPKT